MGVVVKYVQKRGGRYVYRRAVPTLLREVLGRSEEVRKLGETHAEMMRKYGAVHAEVERLFNQSIPSSSKNAQTDPANHSPFELYNEALDRISELGWREERGDADETEIEHRDITAELELEKYPRDEDGEYLDVPPETKAFIKALRSGETPDPTLLDAKNVYIKDRILGTPRERQNLLRLERALKPLSEIVGKNPPLNQITRRHAKKWIELMVQAGKSAANIERTLKPLQAMFKYAELEFSLGSRHSPFTKLDLPKGRPEKREALPSEVISSVSEYLDSNEMNDLKQIWLLMIWSGARIGEVSGLLTRHLVLEHAVPHMVIEAHDKRPLKTLASQRKVPLESFALEAAQDALDATQGKAELFPKFCKERGGDYASQRLNKVIRLFTDDPRHVNHSLRHGIKDLLRFAEIPDAIQNMILGHASKSVGDGYGSESRNLKRMRDALVKAHSVDEGSL